MTRPRLEVAEIFRTHGDTFLDRYGETLSSEQRRALRDIAACRTAALGGHVEECDRCGHRSVAYLWTVQPRTAFFFGTGHGVGCTSPGLAA